MSLLTTLKVFYCYNYKHQINSQRIKKNVKKLQGLLK